MGKFTATIWPFWSENDAVWRYELAWPKSPLLGYEREVLMFNLHYCCRNTRWATAGTRGSLRLLTSPRSRLRVALILLTPCFPVPLLSKVHDHHGFENAPKNNYAANLESQCTKSRDQGYRSFACAAASWKFYLRCIGVIRPSNRRRLVRAGTSNRAEPSPPCAIKRRNLNENPA